MSRAVPVRPPARGPPLLMTPDQPKSVSPDENALFSEKIPKLEPMSAATSPELLYPPNISLHTTPVLGSQWDHASPGSAQRAQQEKARRKLVLDPPSAEATKAKKAKVTTPVSRAKTAAGNSPAGREMDPSMISLLEESMTSSSMLRLRGGPYAMPMLARSSRQYDLNEELGPDPIEANDNWMELFGMGLDPLAQGTAPVKTKKRKVEGTVKEEPLDEEVLLAAAAAAVEDRVMTGVKKVPSSAAQPPKAIKVKKEVGQGGGSERGSPTTPGGRLENSLLVLTKKFMDLRNHSSELNLNEAAATLGVQKRRLYDITNVLEGIDLVVKTGKNSIKWIPGPDGPSGSDGGISEETVAQQALLADIAAMEQEEKLLDDLVRDLTNAFSLVKEDPTDKPYAYVNFEDLQRAVHNLGDEKLTIAVKAGSNNACVEVADPVETGRFEMAIRCPQGLHAMIIPSAADSKSGAEMKEIVPPPPPPPFNGDVSSVINEADDHLGHQSQQENHGIVLPSSAVSTLRQPCDDLITPSKMVEDNACLSEYLSPLKFVFSGGSQMGLPSSSQDSGPFLSLDTPNNGAVLAPGSQPGPPAHPYYYSTDDSSNLTDLYSQSWLA